MVGTVYSLMLCFSILLHCIDELLSQIVPFHSLLDVANFATLIPVS
jgi:hypothetical protein